MTTPMKEDDEPDFLEREIAERTARNPDYPRLLAEAEENRPRPILLEDVKRLTLEPGDILVIKVAPNLNHDVAEQIMVKVSQEFPEHRVMVIPADWDLETIRPEALDAESPDDSSPLTS